MSKLLEDARMKVDLVSFIESHYGKPKKVGGSIRWRVCPNCGDGGVNSHRLSVKPGASSWTCFACGNKGSVLDFAAQLTGREHDLVSVAKDLLGSVGMSGIKEYDADAGIKIRDEMNAKAANLKVAVNMLSDEVIGRFVNKNAFRYLANERHLGKDVVCEALDRKILAFLPDDPKEANGAVLEICGSDLLMSAGVLKEGKTVSWAYRPILLFAFDRMSCEFRIARKQKDGEQKALRYGAPTAPWYWKGTNRSCVIAEGALDMLSQVCIDPGATVIGLPSSNICNINWLKQLVDEGLADDFIIRLDNDLVKNPEAQSHAGNLWSGIIRSQLLELGISSVIDLPEAGDINEQVKILRTSKGL
jgi:hypothetical protein